ncbi:unnamed protein product [Caenorhabditis angaria]|uniref:Uncharacterized protein n=1 Tax=Caenorhabditis angaria TaxID=860376 RepID=A0A9P1MUY1_9PELO|nr:unnamed protein product [Caenorhabditis angaria]
MELYDYFYHPDEFRDIERSREDKNRVEKEEDLRDSRMEEDKPTTSKNSSLCCHVCDSPTANTLHFGGRSCKACAAFFRRTVSMSMTYECIGSRDEYKTCKIHHELRMLCRHCRFGKCLTAGMKPESVQAKKEEIRVAKRRSRGLVRNNPSAKYDECVHSYLKRKLNKDSPKSEPEINIKVESTFTREPSPQQTTITTIIDYSQPANIFIPNMVPVVTSVPPIDPLQASTSSYNPSVQYIQSPYVDRKLLDDSKVFELLDSYVRSETSLNDRRRIMYTNTKIGDIFDVYCDCPYQRCDLKPFNFRTFCGFVKHDFIMILDFVSQFPEFSRLSKSDKYAFYRMACAVDSMISSAYYTYRTGIDEDFLVLFNGDFIKMNPKPISGDEPNAEQQFENDEEHTKYKTIMPLKLQQYFEMAVPFSKLEVSFEEFVLLKALTIWQVSNYKLMDDGRSICARQKDEIVRALHRIVEERGDEDPAIRVGQLLLSMSYIMEQVHAMTSSYIMITFFDVVSCDSVMHDLLFR